MKFLSIIFILIPLRSYALQCEWWQTQVKSHQVSKHQRNDSMVSAHPRQEHCREKWKNADKIISAFNDQKPNKWSHEEDFKAWKKNEIEEILKIYENIPSSLQPNSVSIHRAKKSVVKENPASTDIITKSMVLYDIFFQSKEKKSIVEHELSHLAYENLSYSDIIEYSNLSGWTLKSERGKIFDIPPEKVIKEDSKISREEDFANRLELYLSQPEKLKSYNPESYEFFRKRFSK